MRLERRLFINIRRLAKPWVLFSLLFASLALASLLYDTLYSSHVRDHWATIVGAEERQLANDLQSRFRSYENEALDQTRAVAGRPEILAQLVMGDSLSEITLFESLIPASPKDVSIEVYDRTKRLVGWVGHRGPSLVPEQIAARESSFVQDGPLYSYLAISIPVKQGATPAGFVVGKRLFDVTYPINNRFINNDAFTSTFARRLDVLPEFDFSRTAPATRDERSFSVPFTGITGARLGFAYLPRPVLSSRLEEIHEGALSALNLSLFGLSIISLVLLFRWKRPGEGVALLIRSALVWILRYLMI